MYRLGLGPRLTGVTSIKRQPEGATLLRRDLGMAFELGNEARYRVVERLFGVPREQANIITLIALGMLAQRAHARTRRLLRPRTPNSGDTLLGAGVAREVLFDIGGPASRQAQYFGALVVFALAAHGFGPAIRNTIHGIRAAAHDVGVSFKHRYSHRRVATQ
jgi:hypothetical protein